MEGAADSHVAILPSPGIGHLIPLLALASRLHLRHSITSTLLVDHSNRHLSLLSSLPASVSFRTLPPAPLDDLPASTKIETRICLSVARNLPAIRSSLLDLLHNSRLSAFIVDLFAADAVDVARELGIPVFVFYPPNATTLTLFLNLPALDTEFTCEYRDLPGHLRLPGCIPLHGADLLDPVQCRSDDCYRLLLRQCRKYHDADGIMVNSFSGIEPGPCRALQENVVPGRPPVYPVGPLVRKSDSSSPTGTRQDSTGCLQWLDRQPVGSVLYVSFGSGGVLSLEQTMELAAGLEMSGQRFLWVVRAPREGPADADYFGINGGARDPLDCLPEGFRGRTREVGLVVANWVPQVLVLGHPATGGFLSHCGWNSALESLVHGVPMAAWPLYAEQRMNAVMLAGDAGVAVTVEGAGRRVVGRDEVSRVVRELMEGKEVKRRARAVQEAARAALASDGESSRALAEVARRCKPAGECR